ncbi:BlaI/MecI/CopY family transcriptional regulator [Paenibacillus psychroresistens]|uniref:BlaI/MecI/CopY family transcriptional regulator n=1 Tax=Paenibacillus psychroresistens TaxID=1778678 RepID=A0A6B8RW64_9BACL|nr:BlaI/MecI/CopY family transcriptional regulator [Paenibacillus psychroresistens]QGR00143.1 BlaI/MecI/CopY family transcriptional regulator [Paenibacillus psychroresistens]
MIVNKHLVHELGLHRFFGSLEARIMDLFWTSAQLTIKEVHVNLDAKTPISFNAVMTVMNRLWEKGHLEKTSQGQGRTKLTHFCAAQTKDEFITEQTKVVTHGLVKEFGDLIVTHLVDSLEEVDPRLILRLQEKLDQIKKREE